MPGDDRNGTGTATWWWDDKVVDEAKTRFLRRHGVTNVFWSLPWVGPEQRDRVGVGALRQNGFRVSGLGGDPGWALEPGLAEVWARRAVGGGTVTDLHLDIEPWVCDPLPAPLPDLLDGVAEALRRIAAHTRVDVDLPPWIADDHPDHFVALCAPATQVTVAAYRDRAEPVLSFSATARAVLASLHRPYRIGVETKPSQHPHITFADDGRQVLDRELTVLQRELSGDGWFRGLAVHDLWHWRALRP